MPEVGAKGTTRITIPLPTKTFNVSPISDIHMSGVPSVAGSSTVGSSHQAGVKKRDLKDNVHLAEIINVTKLQPVLEEEVIVFANALITQL